MVQVLIVGTAAGLAAALLFASVASGSLLSVLLFYLAPLPLMIAGLGWTHFAALIATVVASASLAAVFGGLLCAAFLIGIALPAWWLSYLTLLGRPVPESAETIEWYPIGRLVLWAALLSALAIIVIIPTFGTDADGFRAGLKQAFERLLHSETDTSFPPPSTTLGVSDQNRLLDFLVTAVPILAAAFLVITSLANLWLAARVVKISGRLKRPWTDLGSLDLPRLAPLLLVAAVVGMFGPDLIGIVAGVLMASLGMAYALVGFAVLHATTRGINGRGFVLAGIYAAVAVFGWPVLLLILLGLADFPLGLRRRMAARAGSPRVKP